MQINLENNLAFIANMFASTVHQKKKMTKNKLYQRLSLFSTKTLIQLIDLTAPHRLSTERRLIQILIRICETTLTTHKNR